MTRGRPKRTTPPDAIATVRLKRATHSRLMSYAGRLQADGGTRATVDTAIRKLLDKERGGRVTEDIAGRTLLKRAID